MIRKEAKISTSVISALASLFEPFCGQGLHFLGIKVDKAKTSLSPNVRNFSDMVILPLEQFMHNFCGEAQIILICEHIHEEENSIQITEYLVETIINCS